MVNGMQMVHRYHFIISLCWFMLNLPEDRTPQSQSETPGCAWLNSRSWGALHSQLHAAKGWWWRWRREDPRPSADGAVLEISARHSWLGRGLNSPIFLGLNFWLSFVLYPIGSMYAIYGNMYHQYTPNVSIYTIHGSYGYEFPIYIYINCSMI